MKLLLLVLLPGALGYALIPPPVTIGCYEKCQIDIHNCEAVWNTKDAGQGVPC